MDFCFILQWILGCNAGKPLKKQFTETSTVHYLRDYLTNINWKGSDQPVPKCSLIWVFSGRAILRHFHVRHTYFSSYCSIHIYSFPHKPFNNTKSRFNFIVWIFFISKILAMLYLCCLSWRRWTLCA